MPEQKQVDPKATQEIILHNAVRAMAGDAGAIALWNQTERRFEVFTTYNLGPETLDQLLPLLNEVIPDLATSRESFDTLSTLIKGSPLPSSETGVLQNPIIVLPLQYTGEAVGLIYVLRPADGAPFSRTEQRILSAFAQQAAIALENANLAHLLAEEKQRVEAILEGSAEGIMSIDSDCWIIGFNSAMERLTGWSRTEAVGVKCSRILNLRDFDDSSPCVTRCPMRLTSNQSVSTFRQEGTIQSREGQNVDVAMVYAISRSADGTPLNAVINFHDITRLREVDNLRSTFLAMLGHELQTPLSLIKGYAATLARKDAQWDDLVRSESLRIIEEECDRLSRLVSRLLVAARIESGEMVLKKEAVRIAQIIAKLVRRFSAATDIHTFEVAFDPDFPSVEADPELIEEVFLNLMDNAVKYSPHGGRIEIVGKIANDFAEVAFTDEGIGISLRDTEQLFKRFARGHGTWIDRVRGVGLGLFISKSIVDAHGGRIEVGGQAGKGSRFIVFLPVK